MESGRAPANPFGLLLAPSRPPAAFRVHVRMAPTSSQPIGINGPPTAALPSPTATVETRNAPGRQSARVSERCGCPGG